MDLSLSANPREERGTPKGSSCFPEVAGRCDGGSAAAALATRRGFGTVGMGSEWG